MLQLQKRKFPMGISKKTIWIDLENSPHVPFFKPIIRELEKRGYATTITARDCFQVCALADLQQVPYRRVGRHYGKNKIMKGLGLLVRAAQMAPLVIRARPRLAISHGSRSQVFLAKVLRIPSVMIFDYEHSKGVPFLRADLNLVPELISGSIKRRQVSSYPGIKEDVYVPAFEPQPGILRELGIEKREIVVTVRPPATEAHYFVPQSEELFEAAIGFIASNPATRIVMLPRNDSQSAFIREKWPELVATRKVIIPAEVVDGLNLIWHSDLVISGGGTMNREAAALGVPVYSTFRGEIGNVDRYLAQEGRLVLIESVEELATKIVLEKWKRPDKPDSASRPALQRIVSTVENFLKNERFGGRRTGGGM
jgi:predicted glycosyltransferase